MWGSIMSGTCTPLHVFDAGTLNAHCYREEVLQTYVMLLQGRLELRYMDDNEKPQRVYIVDDFL